MGRRILVHSRAVAKILDIADPIPQPSLSSAGFLDPAWPSAKASSSSLSSSSSNPAAPFPPMHASFFSLPQTATEQNLLEGAMPLEYTVCNYDDDVFAHLAAVYLHVRNILGRGEVPPYRSDFLQIGWKELIAMLQQDPRLFRTWYRSLKTLQVQVQQESDFTLESINVFMRAVQETPNTYNALLQIVFPFPSSNEIAFKWLDAMRRSYQGQFQIQPQFLPLPTPPPSPAPPLSPLPHSSSVQQLPQAVPSSAASTSASFFSRFPVFPKWLQPGPSSAASTSAAASSPVLPSCLLPSSTTFASSSSAPSSSAFSSASSLLADAPLLPSSLNLPFSGHTQELAFQNFLGDPFSWCDKKVLFWNPQLSSRLDLLIPVILSALVDATLTRVQRVWFSLFF